MRKRWTEYIERLLNVEENRELVYVAVRRERDMKVLG